MKNTKHIHIQVANLEQEMQFFSKYTRCSFPCLDRAVSTATHWTAKTFPNQMIKYTEIKTESRKENKNRNQRTKKKKKNNRKPKWNKNTKL